MFDQPNKVPIQLQFFMLERKDLEPSVFLTKRMEIKSVKVEIASVDKNGYHLGTSTTNLVSIDSRGRYRWKIEHEIHDDKVVELQILRFRLKVSLVEQNECGNNISSTILVDDNGARGWAYRKKLSKLASAKPLWFETAFSMPMSSNTYVQINMTQKVGKNDENGGMVGSVILMAKNCPLLQFEVSDIKAIHKKDRIRGRGIPKGTYVEDILGNKVYLKNNDLDLKVFCSQHMIKMLPNLTFIGETGKPHIRTGSTLSPVEKKNILMEKLKELEVQKEAADENLKKVVSQVVESVNETENSITVQDGSKIYDNYRCDGEGIGDGNYILRIVNNNTLILGKKIEDA